MNYFKTRDYIRLYSKDDNVEIQLPPNTILKSENNSKHFIVLLSSDMKSYEGEYVFPSIKNYFNFINPPSIQEIEYEDIGQIIQYNKNEYFKKIFYAAFSWGINNRVDKDFMFDIIYKHIEENIL